MGATGDVTSFASDSIHRPSLIPANVTDALEHLVLRGFRVFPCRPRGKQPLIKGWQEKASSNLFTIHLWAERYSGCNWGVATGPESGVFVLDVDGEAGRKSLAALQKQHGALPVTLTSLTGRSDGGEHRWFRYPADREILNSVGKQGGKLGPGLDTRSGGGLVIVPPSTHESGREYQWVSPAAEIADAPGWLLDLVVSASPSAAKNPVELLAPSIPRVAPRLDSTMARKRTRHRPAPRFTILVKSQRRPGLLRYAGALRYWGAEQSEIEDELMALNERCCKPRLPPEKVSALASWIASKPVGGPDPLESAWSAVLSGQHARGYEQFFALAWHLHHGRPKGSPIALPVARIGELMGVHRTQVGRWRERAVRDGWLCEAEPAIPHQLAVSYFFNVPTTESDP